MFWIPAALAGIYVWWRIASDLLPERDEVVPSLPFRVGDGIFASVLAAYYIWSIVAADPESRAVTTELLGSAIVMYGLMALFVTAFLVLRGLSPVNLFGLHPVHWKPVVLPAVVGIAAIFPIVIIATYVSQLLLGEEGGGDATIAFLRSGPGPTALILAGVLVVLVAPFVEEFLFRGLLYGVAKRFGGRVPAIIATSILFAAVHITPGSLLPLFMLSVGLTVAYERTGSLWTPVLMHMAFNGTQFAIILLFPQWIQ